MNLDFSSFDINDVAFFSKVFREDDFFQFRNISGDKNPLHWDEEFSQDTRFGRTIVPLHLIIAPFSMVAGMIFPGIPSLYLDHKVRAIKPVFYGQKVSYTACIVAKSEATKILTIKINVIMNKDVVVESELKVKVLLEKWKDSSNLSDVKRFNNEVDKNALITGANGGIGSSIALKLAKEGWKLLLQVRKKDNRYKTLIQKLENLGTKYKTLEIDLEENKFKEKWNIILQNNLPELGLSALIHTASPGIEASLKSLVKVNYESFVEITDSLLEQLLLRQNSNVIFLSSIAIYKNIKGWQNYIAAKQMSTSYISFLNSQFSSYGLKASSILPGFVLTDFSEKFRNESESLLPEELAESIYNNLNQKAPELLLIEPGSEKKANLSPNYEIENQKIINSIPKEFLNNNETKQKNNLINEKILKKIFNENLNIDYQDISGDESIEKTPKWDSLGHFSLLACIEDEFDIKFSSSEIERLTSFKDILEIIKTNEKDKK